MLVDACSLSTPALLAFLLLPSLLGVGTIATASRLAGTSSTSCNLKLTALQTAPLAAGSLAGLVLLRQPSASLVLALGVLAALPLLVTLYAAGHPLSFKAATSRSAVERKDGQNHLLCNGHSRKDKPSPLQPLMDDYRSPTPSSGTAISSRTPQTDSPPVPATPTTDTDNEYATPLTVTATRMGSFDKSHFKVSAPSSRRASPSPLTVPIVNATHATLAPSSFGPTPITPITTVSSAATSAASTHPHILSEAQLEATNFPRTHPSTPCAFEAEFVRMLMRSAARSATRPEEPAVAFGSWPKEWPMFWEGAGLAPKGCW